MVGRKTENTRQRTRPGRDEAHLGREELVLEVGEGGTLDVRRNGLLLFDDRGGVLSALFGGDNLAFDSGSRFSGDDGGSLLDDGDRASSDFDGH